MGGGRSFRGSSARQRPARGVGDIHILAQDKGGPSKGGFLNHRSFSYTDLYVCNEINGMYI